MSLVILMVVPVFVSRNYRLNGNANFCKGTKLAKLLRELKPTPVSCNKNKAIGFSHMSVMANLGALQRDDL